MLLKQSGNAKQQSTWRICIVFSAKEVVDSTTTYVSTIQLLEPLAKEIFVITDNFPQGAVASRKIRIINIGMGRTEGAHSNILVNTSRFVRVQLKISYHLIKIASRIDVVFVAAGAQTMVLPTLWAKLLRKKIVLLHIGCGASSRKDYRVLYENTLFGTGKYVLPRLVERLEWLNCLLSDKIAVFLSHPISPMLKKYASKTHFGCSRFYVDVNSMNVERGLDDRENLVGYIGRLIDMKGVMNFVRAIPQVLREFEGLRFLIAGDGVLKSEIENEIKENGLGSRVTLAGWIQHDRLAEYLNKIKLLVIPSYGETGPHLAFEAMACGTPVLATPVGIIPDVIKDEETGFIMEDNSPECIAKNVLRALNYPDLDKIARNARKLIEREYTHAAAVERYRKILADLK